MNFKKIIAMILLAGMSFSLALYEAIYPFVDKVFPSDKSCDGINTREDIFNEDPMDDFKDLLTVVIMLAVLIVLIVVLVKIDIRLTEYLGYMTGGDPWAGSI